MSNKIENKNVFSKKKQMEKCGFWTTEYLEVSEIFVRKFSGFSGKLRKSEET